MADGGDNGQLGARSGRDGMGAPGRPLTGAGAPASAALSAPDDLRTRLRTATAPEHRALEALPLMAELLSPGLTLCHYQRIVARYAGHVLPLAADAAFRDELLAGPAFRCHALRRDLRALRIREATLAWDSDALGARGPGQRLGVLYVHLGSALGGRLIQRALSRSLGQRPENGTAFFAAVDSAPAWRALTRRLAALPAAGADADAVVSGARAAFVRLHRWLESAPDDAAGDAR